MGAELRAQIAGSDFKNRTKFAEALNASEPDGVVHYSNLTEMLNGKRPIPMNVLFPALDLLGIEFEEFVSASMKRLHQS